MSLCIQDFKVYTIIWSISDNIASNGRIISKQVMTWKGCTRTAESVE